ncbi:hypothetical protein [Flavobacterium sp.]|uniref:hypothetical protein n=1 Tax=Flavobacterium sp. TaxID=239 RepID=UPI0032666E80
MITTEELINILETNSIENGLKSAAKSLLEAISDWPTDISEPNELISELKKHINEKLTFNNIEKFLKALRIEKDTWKTESLSSLLKIFKLEENLTINRDVELEVILERITNLYRKSYC